MLDISPSIGKEFNERFNRKDTLSVNIYGGFNSRGEVIVRDRRGTLKAELPNTDERSLTLGNDPLAICKPSGAKTIDAAKAVGNFTNRTYAAVNAIASEVANIQLRHCKVTGDDQEEVGPDHELLTLLDGVKNDSVKPRAIYPLNPGRVRVKLNKATFPYKLSHYEITIDGHTYRFEPYQILHGKYPDPSDPFVGIVLRSTPRLWFSARKL